MAERRLDPAHPAAEGHFPGNPIIPGAVLLDEILSAMAASGVPALCQLRAAKFLEPVRPGARLVIRWRAGRDGEIRFEALLEGGRAAVTGTLAAESAP